MIDNLLFRIFHFFYKRDPQLAYGRTSNFMAIFLISFIVPIFFILKFVIGFNISLKSSNMHIRYLIGVASIMIMFLCNRIVKVKLKRDRIEELKNQYKIQKYRVSIWLIFLMPIFNLFICPIIYALLIGTIRFPLFNK